MFILIGCAISTLIALEPTQLWTMAVYNEGASQLLCQDPHTFKTHTYISATSLPADIIPEVTYVMSFPFLGID